MGLGFISMRRGVHYDCTVSFVFSPRHRYANLLSRPQNDNPGNAFLAYDKHFFEMFETSGMAGEYGPEQDINDATKWPSNHNNRDASPFNV